jgi:hypothetical protein
VEKPEVKRPFGRPIHRWEYDIKMDIQEVGWKGMDWTNMTQLQALVNAVRNF